MINFPKNFYSDVRIEHNYSSHIRIKEGRLEEIKESTNIGAFIRLFDGKKWYYTSTTDLKSIDKELANLASFATPNPDINSHPVVLKFQKNTGNHCRFEDNSLKNISLRDKLATTKEYCKVVETDPEINFWTVAYFDFNKVKEFSSSIGCNIKFDTQNSGIFIVFRFGNGSDSFMEFSHESSPNFEDLKNKQNHAKERIEKAKYFYKNAQTIPGGDYTVVLSPTVAGIFAHESFGHKSEADHMLGDEEMIKEWELGKIVGSEKLSIYDDGNIIGSGYTPFDDEGNRACKTTLIEKGILKGRLHNAETAAALNEEVTGNARALDFENIPIVRMTSTYIDKDPNMTKEELIKGVKYGIFIDTCKHGTGSSTFTIAPSMAYLIEDGKITKPVKFSVITGNVMKTLNEIDAVSNQIEIEKPAGGGCGKRGQFPLPVGHGGPYVRIKKINVQ